MQIPFQYSLHILHEDGTLEHKEFLGDEHSDPRQPLINQMLKDITPTGSIVAYNQGFELGRIQELANFDEVNSKELLALTERFIDLIDPFRNRGYYHPDFNGSFSIKFFYSDIYWRSKPDIVEGLKIQISSNNFI